MLVYINGWWTAGRRHILGGSSRWIAISQIDREFFPHILRLFHLPVSWHKFVKLVTSSVWPCKKLLHWGNVCLSAHAISQPCRHTTSETFRKGYAIYIYDIKLGMLQVRKNEISLRKCSGSSAHLRTFKGTLVTRESARFDNNDNEPKSQVRLLIENECFSRRGSCRP